MACCNAPETGRFFNLSLDEGTLLAGLQLHQKAQKAHHLVQQLPCTFLLISEVLAAMLTHLLCTLTPRAYTMCICLALGARMGSSVVQASSKLVSHSLRSVRTLLSLPGHAFAQAKHHHVQAPQVSKSGTFLWPGFLARLSVILVHMASALPVDPANQSGQWGSCV